MLQSFLNGDNLKVRCEMSSEAGHCIKSAQYLMASNKCASLVEVGDRAAAKKGRQNSKFAR